MGSRASSSFWELLGRRLEASDRLRPRGRGGRSSSPATDKDFVRVGYEGDFLESTHGEVSGDIDGMSAIAVECLSCRRQEPYKAVRRCMLPE